MSAIGLFFALALCRWQVDYRTEADVRLGSVLVFVRTCTGLQEVSYIFPATATQYFTLHAGRI